MRVYAGVAAFAALLLAGSLISYAGPQQDEIILNEGTRILLRLNDFLSTKTAREGDEFTAQVVEPIYRGAQLVVPSGSIVSGRVVSAKRAGRIRGRAELNLRFETIRLPNGYEENIIASLESLDRAEKEEMGEEGAVKGEGSKKRDAAIIGTGAGIGAGIGAIAGGAKGTAIGAGAGGLIGLAGVLSTRGRDIELPRGTELTIRLNRPLRFNAADIR